MSIYFPDGKGGRKLVGTDSGGGGSYADATTTTSGLMSASDKAKLDGINPSQLATKSDLETITSDYTLPTASETVKGGVKIYKNQSDVRYQDGGLIMEGDAIKTTFYHASHYQDGVTVSRIDMDGGSIYLNQQTTNSERPALYLNGAEGNSGGTIEMKGGTNGNGGVIDMSGSTGGTIKGGVYFEGKPNFLGGLSAVGEIQTDRLYAKNQSFLADDRVLINKSDGDGAFIYFRKNGSIYGDYTIDGSPTISGNPIFTGTPTFQNGANGLDIATMSGATIPTATTSQSGLMSASDKSKLNGIENNAQANVIESVKVNGTALAVSGKAVNIDLSGKVDKVSGKQLSTEDYTTAEKQKLAAIDTSKYVTIVSGKGLSTNDYTTAEKTKLNNLASVTTAGENITISGGTIKAGGTTYTAGNNVTINGGTISAANTTYSDATTAKSGLMSAADKVKLNGVDTLYATKSEVSSAVASVWKFKGTVDSFSSLPSNASVGEVYNIKTAGGTDVNGNSIKAGDNVAKVSNGWDVLAGTIDLSGYATTVLASTSQNGLLSSSDKTWLSTATSILDGHTVKLNGTRIMFGSESNASAGSIDMRGGTFFTGTSFPNGEVRAYPGGTISLNGGEFTMSGFNEHGDGGTISATGLHGGVIDLSGMDSGGTIDLSPNGTITGNVVFTGTPFFQGGASGINGGTTYTAGENITINNGVISATDTKYTAGENITISGGIIKAGADFVNKDVNAERARINANSSHISLNLANITIDGGVISFHGNTYTSFYDDSRIYGNPTFIENPVFKGTPVFQGGVSGIKDATTVKSGFMSASDKVKLNGLADTVSSGNVYIPTTAFDSIMANFTS